MAKTDLSMWAPSQAPSPREKRVLKLCKKQKMWAFLRNNRHILLDEEVRGALGEMYASGSRRAGSPVCPERMLLALVLQVVTHTPDHEVPTLTAVDQRWQMVLDMMGAEEPLMSQGAVFKFRERARRHGLMDRILEKTVRLARDLGGFSPKRVRALIDSSPLRGAGRVEDTFNLLGRAIRQLVEVAAVESGCAAADLADELEVSVVSASSVKAALDLDWSQPTARDEAIRELAGQFERVRAWLNDQFSQEALEEPPLEPALQLVERILEQDTVPDPNPPPSRGSDTGRAKGDSNESTTPRPGDRKLLRGVPKDRLISLSDPDMRAGRKSKTKLFNGYKRHVVGDADVPGLVLGVHLLPANAREHVAAEPLLAGLEEDGFELTELHIDRGYLASAKVHALRRAGTAVVTKAPGSPRTSRFNKYDFALDGASLTCPGNVTILHRGEGKTARFPTTVCRACQLRPDCVSDKHAYGRVVQLHPNERFFRQTQAELRTPAGRARRRERTAIEHVLARVSRIQGHRATFKGLEKNTFHLKCTVVVNNLHVIDGLLAKKAA